MCQSTVVCCRVCRRRRRWLEYVPTTVAVAAVVRVRSPSLRHLFAQEASQQLADVQAAAVRTAQELAEFKAESAGLRNQARCISL